MSSHHATPVFDDMADAYWRLGVMSSPSQLQGYLLGLLAVGYPVTGAGWLELAAAFIDPVEPPAEIDQQMFLDMLAAARGQLEGGGMDLRLLLPDDGVEISQRVDSLSQWCRGFLAGFAYGGKERQVRQGPQQYPADVSEALSDIASISQVGLGDGDEDERQRETSLFELVEYLRLATINIHMECEHPRKVAKVSVEPTLDGGSPADLFDSLPGNDKLH